MQLFLNFIICLFRSSAIVSLSKVKDEEKPVIREGYLKKVCFQCWFLNIYSKEFAAEISVNPIKKINLPKKAKFILKIVPKNSIISIKV